MVAVDYTDSSSHLWPTTQNFNYKLELYSEMMSLAIIISDLYVT